MKDGSLEGVEGKKVRGYEGGKVSKRPKRIAKKMKGGSWEVLKLGSQEVGRS